MSLRSWDKFKANKGGVARAAAEARGSEAVNVYEDPAARRNKRPRDSGRPVFRPNGSVVGGVQRPVASARGSYS